MLHCSPSQRFSLFFFFSREADASSGERKHALGWDHLDRIIIIINMPLD